MTCVHMLSVRAKENQVSLNVEIPSGMPHLYADEVRLKQIMTNLLSNAVKFTDEGGSIIAKTWQEADTSIWLSVKDSGIGMSEEDLSIALTKFGQVDASYNRNHDGTGLGLNLVQSLVSAHQAEFKISSELGVGTLVEIGFSPDRTIIPKIRQQL